MKKRYIVTINDTKYCLDVEPWNGAAREVMHADNSARLAMLEARSAQALSARLPEFAKSALFFPQPGDDARTLALTAEKLLPLSAGRQL